MSGRGLRPRWNVLAALLALPVLQALNVSGVAGQQVQKPLSNLLQSLAAVLAAWLLVSAARRLRQERSASARGWSLVALGSCLFAAGMITFMLVEVALGELPYPSIADVFFVPFYPLAVLGVMSLPREPLAPGERLDIMLDLGALSLMAATVIWHFNLEPLLVALKQHPSAAVYMSLLYTGLDSTLLLTFFFRLVRRLGKGPQYTPLLLLMSGGFCLIAGDLFVGYVSTHSHYASGSPIDMSWVLWSCFAGFSGLYLLRRGDAPSAFKERHHVWSAIWTLVLSQLWVGVVFFMLLWALLNRDVANVPLLAAAAIGATFLAATRQVRTLREVASLYERLRLANSSLEDNVRERTAALAQQTELLRQSERQFRGIVETTNEWIWESDPTGHYVYSNPAGTQMLGWTMDELRRRGVASEDVVDQQAVAEQLAESIRKRQGWSGWMIRRHHADGSERCLESNAIALFDGEGNLKGFQGADRDVTERILAEAERANLEAQLLQAQKVEAIGQLAGGIAHDFNNLLTAIVMQVDELRDEVVEANHQATLDGIQDVAQRAAALTRQLLLFSRQHVLQTKPVNLNELLGNLVELLRRLIGEQVSLVLQLSQTEPWLVGDTGMLEQVVVNLVVNARDAMPEGGSVNVATTVCEIAQGEAVAPPGKYVQLSVSDSGCGMSEEVAARIFEPFFTTKEVGRGTGLGLSTVYGIVRQHKGVIDVRSSPGCGTTFTILLPLTTAPTTRPDVKAPASAAGAGEVVLLVEDEASVRRTIEITLTRLGYRLHVAANPDEARQCWQRFSDSIDVVLTDMVMPGGTSGLELATELLSYKPELKVIVMSGYSADTGVDAIPAHVQFIQKPFRPSDLASKIRASLDAA